MAKKFTLKDHDALTLDALKEHFGDEEGARLYAEVARAGGYFDPETETRAPNHPLDLKGLRLAAEDKHEGAKESRGRAQEALKRVEAVFAEPAAPAGDTAKK